MLSEASVPIHAAVSDGHGRLESRYPGAIEGVPATTAVEFGLPRR